MSRSNSRKPVKAGYFLEVHRDIYKRIESLPGEVKKHIEKRGLSDKVDWNKINSIVNEKSGIAEDVTL